MLKWLTFISLVLTFFVGVLSALFKTVREHEVPADPTEQRKKNAGKLPILTAWGWALLSFLFILCLLSIGLVVISSKQADESEKKAEVTRQELTNKLTELRQDNEELRSGNHLLQTGNDELRKIADLNFKELVNSQEDSNKKHNQSLDRFSALITRQEDIGRNTAPTIDRISFVLAFRGEQKIAAAFLRRIKASRPVGARIRRRVELSEDAEPMRLLPRSALFPDSNNQEEEDLYHFLTHIRLRASFFREPVQVEFASNGPFYRFKNAEAFAAMADASIMPSSIKGFAEKATEGQIIEAYYDTVGNRIFLEAFGLTNLYKGLTTWEELGGNYVAVSLDPLTTSDVVLATRVDVYSLTLLSTAGTKLEVRDFKPFKPDDMSFMFVARIPTDAKWSR
jgi:hypothetical protein